MKRWTIAVVGAGASGLMAARAAGMTLKKRGIPGGVLVLEGNDRPGRKLLATGNGRCNLTHVPISPDRYHGDTKAAERLLSAYPGERVLEEFKGMGLFCRVDGEGRAYPNSFQAQSVLQALLRGCEEAGVQLIYGFRVENIQREPEGFLLKSETGEEIRCGKCILSCGGAASPRHSLGGGYRLAESLGHKVTPLTPSLVPVRTSVPIPRQVQGTRCRVQAGLYGNGDRLWEEKGEVLFGDGVLSGICLFDLSSRLRELPQGAGEIRLDLLEEMDRMSLAACLKEMGKSHPNMPGRELFSGFLPLSLGRWIAEGLEISESALLGDFSPAQLERAAGRVKDLRFPVTGTASWDKAQVTAGGVPLKEVDLRDMRSRKQPGLFLCGELLNVDGDCGGYNLHWAWITGMRAGEGAGKAK